jgi:PAS domain S-box-containing protein
MNEIGRYTQESSIHVLYIDDDQDLLDLTKDFLETKNNRFDVETISSPEQGLRLIKSNEYDAIISDYQMPQMDGLAVLDTLRSEYETDIPFIIFTGKGRTDVAIEALNLGADRYIQKGGDPTSQYGVLAQAIEQEVAHQRTKRQLHKRDENLQIVLDSIGDAVITTDIDGQVTRMNQIAEELTGWNATEAVGQPLPEVFEILNHETRQPEENPAQKVLESGDIVGLANGTILKRRDGSERFIADSAAPIESDDGAVLGVVIVFRDVTDEYQSRERQRQQRQTIIDVSIDDDITNGNLEAGARTITEAAAETLDVDRVGIWLFEDDNTVLRNIDLYEKSSGQHNSGSELAASEYPNYFGALETHRSLDVPDAQNDRRTAELADECLEPLGISSLLDATIRSGGDVVGVVCHEHVGASREWTDDECRFAGEIADQVLRLRSNRQQREHEQALKQLHSIATDITSYDIPEKVCQRTIEVAETILEFDQCVINLEENGMLPITAVSEGFPPDGVTAMSVDEGVVGKTYRTGKSFLFTDVREAEEANPQGPYRSAISIPIGDHGVFQAVSEQLNDFSEDDKELAELLVSHSAQALDQLDKERALRQQNKRLDEFASVVSHDLRNPLNVAQGRLELAQREYDNEHLDDVAQALDRMGALIDELLVLAREGETAIEPEPVNLREIVEECWQTVETAEATLTTNAEYRIQADEGRVQQLMENLIRNAIEHGGRTVTIRVGELEDGFFVQDTGPGIPAEKRSDVLEMGYSTTDEGTGFGLSIVKRIAEAHVWDVSICDGNEGGARIEFTGVSILD